jgi:hypothetical protein
MASSTGSKMLLADPAHAAYHLPLRHRIHGIDVIHPLHSVPIALMHRVDAQKARPFQRIGLAPFPDRGRARARRLPLGGQFAVAHAPPQIVQMRHRDSRQPRILGFAELFLLPFQNVHRRRPAQPMVRPIQFRQQRDVLAAVLARKPPPPVRRRDHHSPGPVLPDQPRHLRQAQSGYLAQVGSHHSPPFFVLHGVLLSHQHALHPSVPLLPLLPLEGDPLAAFQELLDL